MLNEVNPPPDRDTFNKLKPEERLLVLAKAWQDQTTNLLSCNKDKSLLQLWVDTVKAQNP